MTLISRRSTIAGLGAAALAFGRSSQARAATGYGPGVTDTEIKLGTTAPYSGPASGYGVYGQAQTAYFQMVNDNGGINGRKINLVSLDNAFSPPKAVEQTRKLVESEEVSQSPASWAPRPMPRSRNISTRRRCRACS